MSDFKLVDPRDISLDTKGGTGGRKSWITVSKHMLYISRHKGGRSYWVLSKIRPKMTFNDKKLTLRVGGNKITFRSPKRYAQIKILLSKGGKTDRWLSKGLIRRRSRRSRRSRKRRSRKLT